MGRRVCRNYYKGHMDKTKGEGGSKGGRWVWLQWGEGLSGTTVKDTWTKARGRVEAREGDGIGWGQGEWWGENADNCNLTTIK